MILITDHVKLLIQMILTVVLIFLNARIKVMFTVKSVKWKKKKLNGNKSLQDNSDKKLIPMFLKSDFQLLLTKLNLLLVIHFLAKNAKLTSIFIAMLTLLILAMVKTIKFGNVNFVILTIKYLLKMRKNHKIKLWTIFLKQLHKFRIKRLMGKKIYQLYFVLINQAQCAVHSLFRANIK